MRTLIPPHPALSAKSCSTSGSDVQVSLSSQAPPPFVQIMHFERLSQNYRMDLKGRKEQLPALASLTTRLSCQIWQMSAGTFVHLAQRSLKENTRTKPLEESFWEPSMTTTQSCFFLVGTATYITPLMLRAWITKTVVGAQMAQEIRHQGLPAAVSQWCASPRSAQGPDWCSAPMH